ncbi:Protein F47B7.1 [Aphelenchoides avenae]|nr:Protein F47B7.1 [Aphelenchus avenae]
MVETVGVVHDSDAQKQQSPVDRFMLRANPRLNAWTAREKIECIFSIFFPPVAVLYHGGRGDVLHYVLNIVLWILGWVPGTIHAVWYCFYR